MTDNKGFLITCLNKNCEASSKIKESDERLLSTIKVLHHNSKIRFVCTKCDQQIILD